ncbi:MAG: hypothetical protein GX931_04905 [Acholeplasmataceae bacterium]|nr:hypothetical protein [Acholeplasmataceae bacterium]
MQKNRKSKEKEVKKQVAPSKSGVRRGEQEESKVAKILINVGVTVLIALVIALVVALIVVSVKNKKPKESPLKDLPHVVYTDVVSVVVDHELAALNENEHTRAAYNELIKSTSYIIFYREEDLKNTEFVEAVKALSSDSVGVVFFNLSLDDTILGAEDTVLPSIDYSDPKLLPFVIKITESQSVFTFTGTMEDVLKLIK